MMPLYEYTCDECRRDFELLIRGAERAECPTCGGTQLTRLISAAAAPRGSSNQLPLCETPLPGGCGLPQCGGGQCAME